MTDQVIRVGIVGANPDRGWGSGVHRLVLDHLPGFTVTAVATSRKESAEESARRFGIPHAFTDVTEMAAHPEVDLVSICVLAPYHHDVAMQVLAAGKHVYCEWPLSTDTASAITMRDLAVRQGVAHAIGLQMRGSPAIRRLRDLIADGFVGEVLSATLYCAIPGMRDTVPASALAMASRAAGTTTLSIHAGHALDALRFLVGDFQSLSASVLTQFPKVTVIETGAVRDKDAPDQVLVHGVTRTGAAVAAHIGSVASSGFGMELRVHGTEGFLSAVSDSHNPPPMMPLALRGARAGASVEAIAVAEPYDCAALPGDLVAQPYPGVFAPRQTLVGIANLYARLGEQIRGGPPMTPDFGTAVELHRLLDAIDRAAATGARQTIPLS